MWTGSLKDTILLEQIYSECEAMKIHHESDPGREVIDMIKKEFPECNQSEVERIFYLIKSGYTAGEKDKSEFVLTAPKSFNFKARNTSSVVYDMVKNAKKSITITGYSISAHVTELLDEIVNKSRQGVFVNLYLNDYERKTEQLEKVLIHNNRYIKIFDYNKSNDDKMAALHAKLIVVDEESFLISSSNLSYHGLEGNIELGVKIQSAKKAKELEEILKQLVREKVFSRIRI